MTSAVIQALILVGIGLIFLYYAFRKSDSLFPKSILHWGFLFFALILFGIGGYLYRQAQILPPNYKDIIVSDDELNEPAKNFTFNLVSDDSKRELAEYKGQVVLLNFWATWCGPCIKELPALARLQKKFASEGLVVLALSDEPRTFIQTFQESYSIEITSAYLATSDSLPHPFRRTLALRPVTYIIDREGYIRRFYDGARSYAFFEKRLRSYLQTP